MYYTLCTVSIISYDFYFRNFVTFQDDLLRQNRWRKCVNHYTWISHTNLIWLYKSFLQTVQTSKFQKIKKKCFAVQLDKVSPLISGRHYYNPKIGSFVKNLSFQGSDIKPMKISDVIYQSPQALFHVVGELKWAEHARSVNVHGHQKCLLEIKE